MGTRMKIFTRLIKGDDFFEKEFEKFGGEVGAFLEKCGGGDVQLSQTKAVADAYRMTFVVVYTPTPQTDRPAGFSK